ncbi:MAG: hypothetical protein HY783_03500 [Chloroflexi bacterium]|nr:hypothetical protein [Chloroflexota bacterium]
MSGSRPNRACGGSTTSSAPAFWGEGRAEQPLGAPFNDRVWQQAQPGLRRVYDQFRTWQEDPEAYAAAREKWYRALTMEMGMRMSSVEEYVGR